VREVLSGVRPRDEFGFDVRLRRADGSELLANIRGTVLLTETGSVELRGSLQDITSARQTAESLALAHATAEVAAREHQIADELQRDLLPQDTYDLPGVEVATYYRAGVAGTQVGGDWFDVIPLDRGRLALAVGDVMGRGVRAAAVMGQVRSAVRAYARLDLAPADLLTSVDSLVCDLFPDQIITCAYAVLDPAAGTVDLSNAGHVPPLVAHRDGSVVRLGQEAQPPLGLGRLRTAWTPVDLLPDDLLVFYTDGLVERRDQDPETGVTTLARALAERRTMALSDLPGAIVHACLPGGPEDDVALLAARLSTPPT
jgi:serine phosphatase RsbU (regulator of sigma subunit)